MVKLNTSKRKRILMKKFTPTYYAQSIYEIPATFFKEEGVETLVIDLDNTLAAYDEHLPTPKTIEYIESLVKSGLRVFLISNNRAGRVKEYAEALNLPYLAKAYKPLTRKIKKFLQKSGVSRQNLMMVGDQILTDVFCARNLGVKIILTEQLVERDQFTTRFNRLLDRPIRRKLKRQGKLKEWHTHGR